MKTKYTYDDSRMDVSRLDDTFKTLNPVCLDILHRRGYNTNDQLRDILFPSLDDVLRPLTCKDIDAGIAVLESAVRKKQRIVVYRDYDVDGIAAGAVAVECLRELGAVVSHYVNRRDVDGFGICGNGIDTILSRWPDTKVILTVDNGIAGVEAADYAKEKGLTLVITDHHEPGDTLPKAAAVIDLKRKDETYHYHDLCGCGLIFRVMVTLYQKMGVDISPALRTLDMVALATVADVVPLLGENRALVQAGIKRIEERKRPFFDAMLRLFDVTDVTAHYTLAFQIAPTLNSLSRMGEDTDTALEVLISHDSTWVELRCIDFKEVNQKRKDETKREYDLAVSMIDHHSDEPVIVLYSEEFDEGIVGIIAGKLKEEYWKPAIVLARDKDGGMKGSGRSLDEFPLKDNLDKCADLLKGYGGHMKAAGLSLDPENFPAFRERINALAKEELAGKSIEKKVPLAAVLDERTLTEDLIHDLRVLEPYGEGFPEPVFGLVASPDEIYFMGSEKQHVKLKCQRSNLSILAWNQASKYQASGKFPRKYIGKPGLNIWNGIASVQFVSEAI